MWRTVLLCLLATISLASSPARADAPFCPSLRASFDKAVAAKNRPAAQAARARVQAAASACPDTWAAVSRVKLPVAPVPSTDKPRPKSAGQKPAAPATSVRSYLNADSMESMLQNFWMCYDYQPASYSCNSILTRTEARTAPKGWFSVANHMKFNASFRAATDMKSYNLPELPGYYVTTSYSIHEKLGERTCHDLEWRYMDELDVSFGFASGRREIALTGDLLIRYRKEHALNLPPPERRTCFRFYFHSITDGWVIAMQNIEGGTPNLYRAIPKTQPMPALRAN